MNTSIHLVLAELARARAKFGPMRGPHEGWAILREEVDELWDLVKSKKPTPEAMAAEAVQVGAMALKFLEDVCRVPSADAPEPADIPSALTSPEGRATAEELVAIWAKAFDTEQSLETHVAGSGTARLAAARAVAARVRRERPACLVERLVAANVDFCAFESVPNWTVRVHVADGAFREATEAVLPADVPATLARLAGLGEK